MGSLDLFTAGIAASLAVSCGSCGSSSEPEAPKVGTAVVGQAKLTGGSAPSSLPSGGTAGQVLAKKSNSDYDVEWKNVGSNGGGSNIPLIVTITETTDGNNTIYTMDKTAGEIINALPLAYVCERIEDDEDFVVVYSPILGAGDFIGYAFDSDSSCYVFRAKAFNALQTLYAATLNDYPSSDGGCK